MKSDQNGCSTCPPGEERWEAFRVGRSRKQYIQYDYRTPGGKLFSCVAPDIKTARNKRDRWLIAQALKGQGPEQR